MPPLSGSPRVDDFFHGLWLCLGSIGAWGFLRLVTLLGAEIGPLAAAGSFLAVAAALGAFLLLTAR